MNYRIITFDCPGRKLYWADGDPAGSPWIGDISKARIFHGFDEAERATREIPLGLDWHAGSVKAEEAGASPRACEFCDSTSARWSLAPHDDGHGVDGNWVCPDCDDPETPERTAAVDEALADLGHSWRRRQSGRDLRAYADDLEALGFVSQASLIRATDPDAQPCDVALGRAVLAEREAR